MALGVIPAAFSLTIGQLGDPRFRRVLFIGVGLTFALLVAVTAGFLLLVNWLLGALHGYRRDEREALIRACAAGAAPPPGPPAARAAIARHAGLAAVVTDFIGGLEREGRRTPYPARQLAALLDMS